MNRPSPAPAARLVASPSVARVSLPELRFRAMPPSESLLLLAREQDALCRAVHPLDPAQAVVTVEREGQGRGAVHMVRVQARYGGLERCGDARHTDPALAVCAAYSELLRALVHATPCPCRHAA